MSKSHKKNKPKSRIMQRFTIVLIVMIVLVTGGMSTIIYFNAQKILETTAMENNHLHMQYIAEHLDLEAFEQLVENPVEGELYEQLQQQLTQFLNHTKLTYLYVMAPGTNGQQNTVIADAGDLNGDDTYAIGEEAEEASYDEILQTLNEENIYVEMVAYKEWDHYLSVYMPLKNAAGETFAIIAADEIMTTIAETKSEAVKTILPMIILLTSLLSIIVIALIYLYFKKLLKPIDRIRHATLNLSYGNIKRTEQLMNEVTFKSKDEISRFGHVYKSSVASLSDVIKESMKLMKEVTKSTATIESSSKFITTEQPKVVAGVTAISSSIHFQKDIAEQSVNAVDDLTQGVETMTDCVQTVVKSMDNMSTLIQKNAEEAKQTSAHVLTTANKVVKTKNNLQQLSERYATIEEMVATIQDIAKKTTTLAMNASLEASQSGEVGKGFKIVASEVKKLANVTAHSADNIYEHIRTFKKVTRAVVENMERTTREVQHDAHLVTAINQDLNGLLQAASVVQQHINKVNEMMQQVQSNAQQVSKVLVDTSEVSAEVLSDTEGVVNAMQQQQQSMLVLQKTIDELSDYVTKLNRLTELYTV